MFFIRLWRWIFGWVSFKAEGGFPERLLNLIYLDGMEVWNVKRKGENLYGCCFAKDYKKLRLPVRKTGMRMKIEKKHGMPFSARKHSGRIGVAVGFVAFIAIINLLSQRCWVIEVSGNNRVDSEIIKTVMEEYGIVIGADIRDLDIEVMQLGVLQKLPDLSWAVVNINGSKATIEVNERIQSPDIEDNMRPSNISAKCDGRILAIDVQSGLAQVKAGDAVVEGTLLVSGVTQAHGKTQLVRSRAVITAETHRKFEVKIPLIEKVLKYSEAPIYRNYLSIFALNIPTHTSGEIPEEYTKTEKPKMFSFLGTDLPIGVLNERYDKLVEVEVTRSETQAAILAEQELAEILENHLKGATIHSAEKNKKIENGVYILQGEYKCTENIGWESPLTSMFDS